MKTNLSLAQRSLTPAPSLSFTHFVTAGNRGVVDGSDGCANVCAEKQSDALDYSHRPVYTRFLTTFYKIQLLEITFTSNLNTKPELKKEIDHIMESVHLEE
jgi:hypothetical protein